MATTLVKFISGHPVMRDYTPVSAVTAGDVIVLLNRTYIAHKDIAAGAKGAVAVCDGVYEGPCVAGGTNPIPDGTTVYWDATDLNVQTDADSGTNELLGVTVGTPSATDEVVRFVHLTPATASA